MSFGSNILNSKPSLEYIIDNIIGYSTLIDTPFGRLCSVYADHTATGRPFRPIENLIQKKIKPMIANSHTESSEMGAFSTKLLSYAQASILKSFNVTNKSHFSLPTGYGATGAFERLAKILRIEEIKKEKICSPSKCLEDIPLIIISPYEHHSNILPW
jgi:selenocysteine lyase/cysteine desulfurase